MGMFHNIKSNIKQSAKNKFVPTDAKAEALNKAFSKADNFKTKHNFAKGQKLPIFLETAFTVYGMKGRLEAGERFLPALGKEVVQNVAYGMAWKPLLGYNIASAAGKIAPEIQNAAQQEANFNANYNFVGGNYIDTENNYASRARAVEQIKRNRNGIRNALGSEARRFHQTY
ncbi:MAG: hypothetical protein ACOCUT_02520 [bacterium]